jgi:hypothetical protein
MNARAVPLIACALLAAGGAYAQPQASTLMEAQPLMHVRDGKVQGCGLRLTGGEAGKQASSWFDVSFNVFRRGLGLAQSIAYEIRRSDYEGNSRPAKVPVQSTWLKVSDGNTRVGENAERRDTLIYTLVMDDVLALFEAVANGDPVTLGIKRWGQRADAVYTGAPLLSSDSRHRMSACLADLASG